MNYTTLATWSVVASSAIFALTLLYLFQRYLTPAVAQAQAARNEEIVRALTRRDEAQAELSKARFEQAQLENTITAMLQQARNEAKNESERIVSSAHRESERILQHAEGELDRARASATQQLRRQLIERSLFVARERARREIDAAFDARIVQGLLDTMSSGGQQAFAVAGE